jgi:protein-S-isoprenylcysteine O-methyltransferase Ste14
VARRTAADLVLFSVTLAELALLFVLSPTFGLVDWVYLFQHLLVLTIALTRPAPIAQDRSLVSGAAVLVAYTYPYAQVAYLRWVPGEPAWPAGSLVLVIVAACLSLASLLTLGRSFGIRPALRSLAMKGPYRLVRHPMYLSYVLADIGYNLDEWNVGTLLLVLAGWAAMVHRVRAEEQVLSRNQAWAGYRNVVRYRLVPGLW